MPEVPVVPPPVDPATPTVDWLRSSWSALCHEVGFDEAAVEDTFPAVLGVLDAFSERIAREVEAIVPVVRRDAHPGDAAALAFRQAAAIVRGYRA